MLQLKHEAVTGQSNALRLLCFWCNFNCITPLEIASPVVPDTQVLIDVTADALCVHPGCDKRQKQHQKQKQKQSKAKTSPQVSSNLAISYSLLCH